jgi:hypothetical protein
MTTGAERRLLLEVRRARRAGDRDEDVASRGRATDRCVRRHRARRRPGGAWLLILLGVIVSVGPSSVHAFAAGRDEAKESDRSARAQAPAAKRGASGAKTLEERIAELEVLVERLRAELDALRGTAGGSASGSGGPEAIQELERRIDAIAQELERLRIGEAAAPAAKEPVSGFGPAASKVYAAKRGVSIGGYGEMLYQDFDGTRDDGAPSGEVDTADFLRGVLYFGYKWTDHVLFNSEVEYEHAVAGEGEPGEVAVEFAYIDYKPFRNFGMRGGLLLVPVGFLTELHEPPIFHGARRPEVETVILPSTWRENGLGVYGDFGPVSYRAYIVAGLDAAGFTADEGIREGRQEGAESKAEDFAFTARLDWKPAPGLLVGGALFTGGAAQGDPALADAGVTLYDAHAEWNARGLHLRGVYARSTLDDAQAVSLANGETIGSRAEGWYAEAAFNVLSRARRADQELSPFVRYEAFDTQAEVSPGAVRDPANDRTVRTYGLTYRPILNVAIKVDYQDFGNRAGTGVDQLNFALGYLF